jgi:hypothetical protein
MPGAKVFHSGLLFGICLVIISLQYSFGQNTYIPLNSYAYHILERNAILTSDTAKLHTSVKPYLRSSLYSSSTAIADSSTENISREAYNALYLKDESSEFNEGALPEKGKLLRYFYRERDAFYAVKETNFFLKFNPVLHTEFGISTDTAALKFINTRGIELRGGIDQSVGFYFYGTDNQVYLPAYITERALQQNRAIPGEGKAKVFKDVGFDFLDTKGYIGLNATEHIAVQFGQDKIFIGDGMRSLIWSDNSDDFLFLKLNTNVWKINYQNVFAQLADYNDGYIYDSLIQKKYAALHHLSVNITETVNIGLFESVIFSRKNAHGQSTGFDLAYLNPIIFYKAVESGIGSPDNTLLGANWKWNIKKRFSFYGQFVLDELIVREFIKNSGWWGNKNALQVGIKYINAFTINYLDLQYELNQARPYTYTYEDSSRSYTHYYQALAHPLGANFREHIFKAWYQAAPQITMEGTLISAITGTDTAGSNWGSDIFLNYLTYEKEYNNRIGQGVENRLFIADLFISWQFWHNVFADGRVMYRKSDSALHQFDDAELYYGIGIRMLITPGRHYF